MLTPDEKATALVVKLNRLTSLEQITWTVSSPPRSLSRGTDEVIPFFMTAAYKNQRFVLYSNRYQTYDGDNDKFYWSERIVLAILDEEDRVLWDSSYPHSAIGDLFETARRQVVGLDSLLDDLLSGND